MDSSEYNENTNDSNSDAERILSRYPDRIPVIIKKQSGSCIQDVDKNKFLVPNQLTMGQFIYVIRKRIKLSPEQGLFLFSNGKLYSNDELMSVIYNKDKSPDKFLYVTYSGENVFGN